MAKGLTGGHGPKGSGRVDRLWESRSYERMYDRPDTSDTTASFLEQPDYIREGLLRTRGSIQPDGHAPNGNEHHITLFWPDLGPFAIPSENTWAAHVQTINDSRKGMHFNPAKYPYFDRIVAAHFPAVMQPKNAGLRANLEVLRNDIMGMYLNDESFDPGDQVYVPLIATIANVLGTALNNDKWWKRPFTRYINVGVANTPGVGAAEMYQHLLEMQDKPGPLAAVSEFIRSKLGMPTRAFGLRPLEQTPFSPRGLSAPPPPDPCLAVLEQSASNFTGRVTNRMPEGPLQKG